MDTHSHSAKIRLQKGATKTRKVKFIRGHSGLVQLTVPSSFLPLAFPGLASPRVHPVSHLSISAFLSCPLVGLSLLPVEGNWEEHEQCL